MRKILMIEDAVDLHPVVKNLVTPLQLQIRFAESIAEAELKIKEDHFDLFILDLKLTDGDGLQLLSQIRRSTRHKSTPLIVLSGENDIAYKLSAFSLGADDYVTKPFNKLELAARIERLLNRTQAGPNEALQETLHAGPFQFEVGKQVVLVHDTQKQIHLTSTEFRIFTLLAKKSAVIFARSQILEHVWGVGAVVTDRTVDSHIYTLRKKLGEHSSYIQSVQGAGYRFLDNPSSGPQPMSGNRRMLRNVHTDRI